uniref:DNA-directed RNA polymerase III subunit RPC9 n=1 Tax=Arundo donax TaxID=35708 RepID=A0A0A9DLQ4_ARUDO
MFFIVLSTLGQSSQGAGAVYCPQILGVPLKPCSAAAMKIKKANAGVLTNFEVLDFLRSRGAKTDPMGCLGAVAASECKVYKYLLKTPACNQTRESIFEFMKRSESFKLAEADKLNVINWRPSSAADAYAVSAFFTVVKKGKQDMCLKFSVCEDN